MIDSYKNKQLFLIVLKVRYCMVRIKIELIC